MNNYFTISELCIDPSMAVPQEIADKLLKHHIIPMNPVRHELGQPITASQKSGWRPLAWEKARGRSGNSQHTFQGKGAVDWTADNLKRLFELIFKHSNYTRIAVYPSDEGHFIHCDHASAERVVFLSNRSSNWTRSSYDEILELTAEDILQVEIGQFETVCMFAALDNVQNLTEALTGLKYAATKNIVLLTGIGIEPDQYHTVRVDLEDITEVLGTPRIALELLPKVWLLEFEI